MEKRKKLIIFIAGLHNKLQGCGVSIASAAGPFTTKKKTIKLRVVPLVNVLKSHFSSI
jgi:hypothetical protein